MFYKSCKIKPQKYEIVSIVTYIVIEYKVIKQSCFINVLQWLPFNNKSFFFVFSKVIIFSMIKQVNLKI